MGLFSLFYNPSIPDHHVAFGALNLPEGITAVSKQKEQLGVGINKNEMS